ncbi:MAG TPA: winged helix-turn-helix domain-containing protein [Blastocatellia bacterium]|nr:winged helix-turn-helix domain-containing protein [Blastocatellia bacterium]
MRMQDKRIYEFADFRLDLGERALSRSGESVPLRPKLFELLIFLIENRGRILEKEEITRFVWGSLSQGSPESPTANLNVNISNLRRELGDDPEKPMLIETVKGRGYRFLPAVRVVESPPARSTHTFLSAVGAGGSAASPALTSSLDRELREHLNGANSVNQAIANGLPHNGHGVPATGARKKKIYSGWRLIAVMVVISALALALAALMAKRGTSDRASYGADFAVDRPANNSSSGAANQAGSQLAGAQTEDVSTEQPRIDSIEPKTPVAWIGDEPIKVSGRGFRPGLSVTMVFPSGGSATLSGVAVGNVSPNEFTLLADFNNNPGEYRIRVNTPDGLNSNWWVFDASRIDLLPEITDVKQIETIDAKHRVAVSGRNFLQQVHAVVIYPDGKVDYLPVQRHSASSFVLRLDPRGHTGMFKVQAQNMGKGSNFVSFNLSSP